MGPHGRDDDRKIRRLRLQEGVEARTRKHEETVGGESDLVFDFTGLHRPDLCDLSLILTARLAAPEERVWVRALPAQSWRVLHALGLDHLFRAYPGPTGSMN